MRQKLSVALDAIAASLTVRDVTEWRLDHGGNPGIDIYLTGGLSHGDAPTDAYDEWDILLDGSQLPSGWAEQIATAAGLLDPNGTGPVVAVVTFGAWA